MLKVITCLNREELVAAWGLIAACQKADKTYRSPYLSNQLNFDPDMPAFFLHYSGEKLVGLLTVYADDEDVEIAIIIHPGFRRQGIAKVLYAAFCKEMSAYPINSVYFQTERVFLQEHPDLLAHWGLVEDEETESWLGRGRESYALENSPNLQVQKADDSHLEAIVSLQVQAFYDGSDSKAVARRYVKEALADEHQQLYILLDHEQLVASCTVDLPQFEVFSDRNYLYGLVVDQEHRGRGLGTYLVKSVVNSLISQNDKTFQIAVDNDNVGAKKLYEKFGFTKQTEVLYLKPSPFKEKENKCF